MVSIYIYIYIYKTQISHYIIFRSMLNKLIRHRRIQNNVYHNKKMASKVTKKYPSQKKKIVNALKKKQFNVNKHDKVIINIIVD